MNSIKNLTILSCISVMFIYGCNNQAELAKNLSLKHTFKNNFYVGAALNYDQIIGNKLDDLNIVLKEFNSITAENILKWERIHPDPDRFEFEPSDSLVAFGVRNNMFIVGHVLVWHQQTPDWVFEEKNGKEVSREVLLERMQEHIFTVVGKYKGRINGWDVVNEAINDDGSLRDTKWLRIIGEDYIQKAFEFANIADPQAELYYNDFNMWKPGKIKKVIEIVKSLKEKNIKVTGIGIQGHWGFEYPSNNEIENALKLYSASDLNLMITELDMAVLQLPENNTNAEISKNYQLMEKYNPYQDGFPDSMQSVLSERYVDFFSIFNSYSEHITRVTFWGVHDGQSWRNNWPIHGRTSYPLLFDRELNPKPVYFEVIKTVKK